MSKFKKDLDYLINKICSYEDELVCKELKRLRNELVKLNNKNLVKINHSVMELICAKYLIKNDYKVNVENNCDGLSCDIFAQKGFGHLIVEVETGFVPPKHALAPSIYCQARIASKITRYSGNSEKFGLATPIYYAMQIHPALIKPPQKRSASDIKEVKSLCDLYYKNPPVTFEEVNNARIHTIYILDVDTGLVRAMDPHTYFEKINNFIHKTHLPLLSIQK